MVLSFIFTLSVSGVAGATYLVHKGDTLYEISNKYKMGYRDLRSLNPQIKYPNQLYIGQSIVVRTPNKSADLVDYAKVLKTQTKYVYGADYSLAPYKADCSSWTKHIYAKFGVNLPRTSSEQSHTGTSISFNNMKKGDLMFFASSGKTISHVGIYMGNGMWISNLNTAKSVQTFSIWGPWTQQHFMWAQRVL
ncbi:MAG TPA: LysM peptidoglycan-binding domain-containing C40 family peptidase [Paenisporosarcina sp.]|nr:LysM peptidoglycan-binding domain-containing C40 family peptidase [Paenisporosarcina sp.]